MTEEEGAPLDIKFQQRFLPNLLSNIAFFVMNLIVGLALVPYFVDTLGYAAYGLIPLATSITSYVTIGIDAINIPISRYLSISLQKGDKKRANITYNTVLVGTLVIVLALIPVAVLVSWFVPSFFSIGTSSAIDVFILFVFVMGSVLVRSWSSNFMATLFALNRLDLRNFVNITNIGLQILLIIILFTFLSPSLIYVGLAYFTAAFISLILAIYLSHRNAPYLAIKPILYSGKLFLEIIKVAFWSLIDKFGCILNSTIALLVANRVLGEVIASDYSVALTIYMGLIAVGSLITTMFTPKVYSYVSQDNITELVSFCKSAIKCSGLMISLPIALICLFAPEILSVWMGEEYIYLTPLVWVVVIPVIIWITVSPIGSFGVAFLKVRVSALSAVFTGCLNLVLAIILPTIFNLGVYGIALASIIAVWLHAGLICPIYYAHITHVRWYTYMLAMHKTILYLATILLIGGILIFFIPITSLWVAIIIGGIITLIYILVFPKIILHPYERKVIRSCLPSKIQLLIPKWIL